MKSSSFQFGDWQVDARMCRVRHVAESTETQIEPRAMDVLSALCHRAGTILSADDLLHLCWDGVVVGENQVHKAIAQLRRALRDSSAEPVYIENIRKRGYRTVAPVIFPPGYGAGGSEETWMRQSPYMGLDPFDAAHADVFFGREAAVMRLCATLTGRIAAGRPFVLVLGPSGSGKTSLIQAGLLPALAAGRGGCRVAGVASLDLGDVGSLPLPTALGGVLLDLERDGEPLFAGQSAESIGTALTGEAEGLPSGLRQEEEPGCRPSRFILFIDRLEALFSAPTGGALQRSLFLTALDRLARLGPFVVIAACRNDFYPDLAREPVLMEGKEAGGHFDLAPPTRAEIAQMIRLPAQMADLSFGVDLHGNEHLDDLLCDGVANNPDALPLLQYTLQQLYLQRSPARELTLDAYRALGGIDGAIGRRADAILEGLPTQAQAALPRIFSLIVAAGGIDGSARSLRAPWSALSTAEERLLVRTLVEQRLFVSHVHGREPVFGVAHEALLRQWPRAVAWIAEHRLALRIRARLEAEAQQWLAEGRRADRLLRPGKPLEEALDLTRQETVPLGTEVRALIAASARQSRRADRLRLGVVAGFGLVAAVALFMGWQARQAEIMAAQRRQEAEGLVDYMLGDFAEKLRPLGRLDLLDGVATRALGYLTAEDPGRVPGPLRLRQAKALLTLADVDRSRGRNDLAVTALTRAETLMLANLGEGGGNDPDLLKQLGATAFWFGQIAYDKGDLAEAARQLGRYRDHAQAMVGLAPQDVDAWMELSYALNSLGSLKLRQEDLAGAMQDLESAIALKRRAVERRPDDRALAAGLANGLSWLANARIQGGQLAEAGALYDQQRQILEELRRAEPDALGWSYRLGLAHKLKAGVLTARGQSGEALAALEEAGRLIADCLAKEPDNRLWRDDEAEIGLAVARLLMALGRPEPAAAALDRVQAGLDRPGRSAPSDEIGWWQAGQVQQLRAEILLRRGKVDAAVQAVGLAEAAARKGPPDKMYRFLLSNVLLVRARTERIRGLSDAAAASCREAADNLSPVAQGSMDHRILSSWVRASTCAGDTQAASDGARRLQQIGYRDIEYQQTLNEQGAGK